MKKCLHEFFRMNIRLQQYSSAASTWRNTGHQQQLRQADDSIRPNRKIRIQVRPEGEVQALDQVLMRYPR